MDERIIFEYFTICSLQQCIEYRYTVRKSKIGNGPNGTELPCTKFKKIVYAIEKKKNYNEFYGKKCLNSSAGKKNCSSHHFGGLRFQKPIFIFVLELLLSRHKQSFFCVWIAKHLPSANMECIAYEISSTRKWHFWWMLTQMSRILEPSKNEAGEVRTS